MSRLLLVSLCLSQTIISVSSYCYTRNGTTIQSKAYQPCNNSTKASACCGTNHQGAGDTNVGDDVCSDNGLCQNYEGFDGTNEGQPLWWRQGCTDPTWQSPYCLADVCNGTEYAFENAPVRNCGGNSWCCGAATCCQTAKNVFQLAATVGPTSSIPSATSALSTSGLASSTSANIPASTSSRADANTSGGLSTGAKAGIGVGVAVVVILAIAVVVLLLRLRKFKSPKHDQVNTNALTTSMSVGLHGQKYQPQMHVHDGGYGPVELGQRDHAELWVNNAPQELEVRGRVP